MKRSDLSTRYVLFVVAQAGVNAWEVLSAAVPPKVALAAIQREVDAGNLDYGVWLGRPFLTPQGRAKLAELRRPAEDVAPPFSVTLAQRGLSQMQADLDQQHEADHIPPPTRRAVGGIVHSPVNADTPPNWLTGCMYSGLARVFVIPDEERKA